MSRRERVSDRRRPRRRDRRATPMRCSRGSAKRWNDRISRPTSRRTKRVPLARTSSTTRSRVDAHPLGRRRCIATLQAHEVPGRADQPRAGICAADPHIAAREMIVRLAAGFEQPVPMAGVVPKLSRTPGAIRHGRAGARRAHRRGAPRGRRLLARRRSPRYETPAWSARVTPRRTRRSAQLVRYPAGAPAARSACASLRFVLAEHLRGRAELDHDPARVVGVDRGAPAVVDARHIVSVRDEPVLAARRGRRGRSRRTRCGSRSSAGRARSRSRGRSHRGRRRRAGPRAR